MNADDKELVNFVRIRLREARQSAQDDCARRSASMTPAHIILDSLLALAIDFIDKSLEKPGE